MSRAREPFLAVSLQISARLRAFALHGQGENVNTQSLWKLAGTSSREEGLLMAWPGSQALCTAMLSTNLQSLGWILR